MNRLFAAALVGFFGIALAHAGSAPVPMVKDDAVSIYKWDVSLESAQMFNIDNNPNRYFFMTQMLSVDCEPFKPMVFGPVKIRTQIRSTFYALAIFNGPETYYLGWGPQLRFIVPFGESHWSMYGGGGAGLGYADAHPSDRFDNGLGQCFTFFLTAGGGFRYQFNDRWAAWAGFMWQHLSNANLSVPHKRNTGPDEVGMVYGGSFAF